MRREDTDAEARVWGCLRDRRLGGWRWKRPVPGGPYIVDFLCPEPGLGVEVDGSQHAEQAAYDQRRTAYLVAHGLKVIRFWNAEVLTNTDGVCLTILDALGGDHPRLSPEPKAEGRG